MGSMCVKGRSSRLPRYNFSVRTTVFSPQGGQTRRAQQRVVKRTQGQKKKGIFN